MRVSLCITFRSKSGAMSPTLNLPVRSPSWPGLGTVGTCADTVPVTTKSQSMILDVIATRLQRDDLRWRGVGGHCLVSVLWLGVDRRQTRVETTRGDIGS